MTKRMEREKNMTERIVPSQVYDELYYIEQNGPGGWKHFLDTGGREISEGYGWMRSLVKLKEGMRILDIGCGRGEYIFRCVVDNRVFGVGVDYSEAAVKIANEVTSKLGTEEQRSRMLFVVSDAQKIPFENASFDVIFSHHLVEHLFPEQLQKMLSECNRVLKDEGLLVLETAPNLWRIKYGFHINRMIFRIPFLGKLYCKLMEVDKIPKQAKTSEEALYHVGEQSVLSLRRSLGRNGFKSRVWVGFGNNSRFSKGAFQKKFGMVKGLLLYCIYALFYGGFPFKLFFGDIIYALARPDIRRKSKAVHMCKGLNVA